MKLATTQFGLIKVSGPEASKFLQGQLTCDLEKITPGKYSLAAHCNPKGRVISLFYLFNHENNYYLLLHAEMVGITIAALKKYAIFFKLQMSDASDELTQPAIATQAAQCLLDLITNGVPVIYPQTSGLFLPHEINLQEFNALDFNKGCYTGQEIIARMQFRGKVKNRLYRYQILQDTLPTLGADIYSLRDARVCGSVVDLRQENNNNYAFIIMNEANLQDAGFTLKDNNPINMQLISNTTSSE
jgi:tRNA-modifying protein YgfZ